MSHTLTPEQQVAYNKLVEVSPPSPAEPAWNGFIEDDDGVKIGMGLYAPILDELMKSPTLAVDCETSGTDNVDRWKIHCVTASNGRVAIVLNPRVEAEYAAIYELLSGAESVLFHNAPFDVPLLVTWWLAPLDICDKTYDSLVLARLMPKLSKRDLVTLSTALLGIENVELKGLLGAAGLSEPEWFQGGDIDRNVYAKAAAGDTSLTYNLYQPLLSAVHNWLVDEHKGVSRTPATQQEAGAIIDEVMCASQAMLHLQCAGLPINTQEIDRYRAGAEERLANAAAVIESYTAYRYSTQDGRYREKRDKDGNIEPKQPLRPGNATDVINCLAENGVIDANSWPTTRTGKFSASKGELESLRKSGNALVIAHLEYSETAKIIGSYIDKFEQLRHPLTGKIYPQFGTLGAVSTGRQSASNPPIQQIPPDARPVISTGDETWVSIDWTSVEPMCAAYCAGEHEVYENVLGGGDLYIPIARKAGLIPDDVDDVAAHDHKGRKHAKVILLMLLYGGGAGALADSLGVSVDEASKLRQSVLNALPEIKKWSNILMDNAKETECVVTIGGRVLYVEPDKTYRAVNYFHQGSAADLLMGVLAECQREGIADGLRITIHDEIVCTEEVAPQVEKIMREHNPTMQRFLGHQVIFPTDSHVLEKHWAYV